MEALGPEFVAVGATEMARLARAACPGNHSDRVSAYVREAEKATLLDLGKFLDQERKDQAILLEPRV